MRKVVQRLAVFAALGSTGCVSTDGAIVGHNPGRDTYQRLTPGAGEYVLVEESQAGAGRVVLRRAVTCRTVLGFAREGGALVAVVGYEQVPLAEGRYRWRAASAR